MGDYDIHIRGGTIVDGTRVPRYRGERLAVSPEDFGEIVHDLPGGEWRRVQYALGYRAILVNGAVTFEDGQCTGATPGRLLRHGRG